MTDHTTIVGHQTVCPMCAGDIDPANNTSNPKTGITYCSPDCWSEDVLGGDD